jgi:hypothetical protein
MEEACAAAVRFLSAAGHPTLVLKAFDVDGAVEACRAWITDQGYAITTIHPSMMQRNGKAIGQEELADIMWDAAQAAIDKETGSDETSFECLIAWKDEPGFADRSISLIPCKYAENGDVLDDEDHFFYFDGDKTEAQIRAEYSKENSPEEWYIAADDAVIIAALAAELGLTDGGAK